MLSPLQKQIHSQALAIAGRYRRAETELISVLQEVDKSQLHRRLNHSSLFKYAIHELRLSEPVAYTFISVARKSAEVPALKQAVETGLLSASKASRIVASLTLENATELIDFAAFHTSSQNREVTRRNPQSVPRDRFKPLNMEWTRIETALPRATLEKLKRAQTLQASKGKNKLHEVLDAVLDFYLKHEDPVEKAERVLAKKEKSRTPKELCLNRVNPSKRVNLTAEQKHKVFARDRGRCTHIDHNGKRCETDRWLHVHHIRPVSHGGSNDPANLTTLCSFHHDLVHQLSLPLEGQVSWLRSPRNGYHAIGQEPILRMRHH